MDFTPGQIVSYNLRRARRLHGLTQDAAAERLEPFLGTRWSRVVFSAAERSVTGKRIRDFSVDELVAFAAAFELPLAFFLTPWPDVEVIAAPHAKQGIKPEKLIGLLAGHAEAQAAAHDLFAKQAGQFGISVEREDR